MQPLPQQRAVAQPWKHFRHILLFHYQVFFSSGTPGDLRTNFAKNKESVNCVSPIAVALSFQGGSPCRRKALLREQSSPACISSRPWDECLEARKDHLHFFPCDSASVTSLVQTFAWHMFRAVVVPSGRHHCRDFCSTVTGLKVDCCPAHGRGVLLLEGESSHNLIEERMFRKQYPFILSLFSFRPYPISVGVFSNGG